MFTRLDLRTVRYGQTGPPEPRDAVIWCTGFRPALGLPHPVSRSGPPIVCCTPTEGTGAVGEPRLHLLGYGDWTGAASATLIGVGAGARGAAATEITTLLRSIPKPPAATAPHRCQRAKPTLPPDASPPPCR